MPKSETLEIEAYLHAVSEETLSELSADNFLTGEEGEESHLAIPKEYQAILTSFESPLMEYIRNLQVKVNQIPKEISFISSIYLLTQGRIIHLINHEQGERVKQEFFALLAPLARNAEREKARRHTRATSVIQREIEQILNRCYLVLLTNFSQMQAAIIQGIIYDIERQGVHLPIQSSTEIPTIARQYQPVVQNQAVIIRNMFRHLFPEYSPPDNIHILELCFLGLLEEIQQNFEEFLQQDDQLLHMLSRVKIAQDELLNVKDPNLCNILIKMERIQNHIHDIYNQRWRDGILNDIIATFFYHARFTAYLENKGKIAQKRRYFLASLEHLLNNYEDFYNETLLPQVDLLMEEYQHVDAVGYTFVKQQIRPGQMKKLFQTILDEDRFSVLSDMIVTGEFSKAIDHYSTPQYLEELEKMRKELQHKHRDHEEVLQWITRLWGTLDSIHELLISEIFLKWKDPLSTVLNTYIQELYWFHAWFSTYTLEAFRSAKPVFFQELEQFLVPYSKAVEMFSGKILERLETLSQQVYAFRDRAGDFNLLYTGILSINLKKEEGQFQFELYTPARIKTLGDKLASIQERYVHSSQSQSFSNQKKMLDQESEQQKSYRLYTDEILKTANILAEEKDLLMYCGARKLFTGPHFVEEDFAILYSEIIDIYEYAIDRTQRQSFDPLDSILELKSLRERAQFEFVYERYTEMVKYKALKKAWQLMRKREIS
ncbi:hypothetical protein U27_01666 [Candidatus Vecturithrix granuli]|uniref:Uncharacterized protein n=1 Tax=Vecturithrix granuli TaxID=1499967 RepID=A0A0S6W9R4_VECG1|nr:hypothetical protein U27_01666 [Candidatus Vecturithrix granuli]